MGSVSGSCRFGIPACSQAARARSPPSRHPSRKIDLHESVTGRGLIMVFGSTIAQIQYLTRVCNRNPFIKYKTRPLPQRFFCGHGFHVIDDATF